MSNKQLEIEKLYQAYRKCDLCELHKFKKKSLVSGRGNLDTDVVFVLDRVPATDWNNRRVITDSEERFFLNKIFSDLDKNISDYYFTSSVLCPTKNMKAPVQGPYTKCNPRLIKEISIIQPKIIVAMGTPSIRSLIDKKDHPSLKYHAGLIFQTKIPGKVTEYEMPVMLTYSATGLLREPDWGADGSWEGFRDHVAVAIHLAETVKV